MTPARIELAHKDAILRNNARFVEWLSPLDSDALDHLMGVSDYARQLMDGEACLFAYDGNSSYRHKHVDWLSSRLSSYLYIDRIIIGDAAQRQGLGALFYEDVAEYARTHGFEAIACEVNTRPDNPASHRFHLAQGFNPLGEATYDVPGSGRLSVRYYVRHL